MIDPSQLAALFAAHAAGLTLYARQWLGSARAEDVVQDVFLRLMAQGRHPPNVRAWLYASVRNAAIDEARASSRRQRRERAVASETPGWFDACPGGGDALDADAVQRAVAQLPPRQCEVVTLRVWSGMTLSEVSQVTGIPVSTAHDEYRRGLDALRRLMRTEDRCHSTTTKTTTVAATTTTPTPR